MAKTSGLGDQLYVDNYDISGDTLSIEGISTGFEPLDVTGIDKSAMERLAGKRSGLIKAKSWFNPSNDQQHEAWNGPGGLPSTDVIATYFRGTAIGGAAAGIVGKQATYHGVRGEDGSFTFDAQLNSDGAPVEWGEMLTAGRRVDTSNAMGTAVDNGAATSFGWAGYLHVFAFTGTSVLILFTDSADNSSYSFFANSVFTSVTGPTSERITALSATETVRRYVRVETSGTFSSVDFACMFVRHRAAPVAL